MKELLVKILLKMLPFAAGALLFFGGIYLFYGYYYNSFNIINPTPLKPVSISSSTMPLETTIPEDWPEYKLSNQIGSFKYPKDLKVLVKTDSTNSANNNSEFHAFLYKEEKYADIIKCTKKRTDTKGNFLVGYGDCFSSMSEVEIYITNKIQTQPGLIKEIQQNNLGDPENYSKIIINNKVGLISKISNESFNAYQLLIDNEGNNYTHIKITSQLKFSETYKIVSTLKI